MKRGRKDSQKKRTRPLKGAESPTPEMATAKDLPRPGLRERLLTGVLFAVSGFVAAVMIHRISANTPARDAFYHLRHGWLYAHENLFMTEFPWLPYSIISHYKGDIWYGFHLFLAPFASLSDPILQVKLAGIASMMILLALLFAAGWKLKLQLPFLWPFVLVLSITWRLVQIRPHVISLGLGALVFAFAVNGGVAGVFLASLFLTFIHLTFFWFPVLIVLVVTFFRWRIERAIEWKKLLAAMAGVAAGWLLRPNPVGAAKVVYVQTVRLFVEKQQTALAFGRELYPIEAEVLLKEHGLFILVWVLALGLFAGALATRRGALAGRPRVMLWGALVLSTIFFVMTFTVSTRTVDQWTMFAVLFVGGVFTHLLAPAGEAPSLQKGGRGRRQGWWLSGDMARRLAIIGGVVLLGAAGVSLHYYTEKIMIGISPYRLQKEAQWLGEHTKPGAVVFHVSWGIFPELFYWNLHNRYIGGMDPIFQYVYDQERYWKTHHLLSGKATARTWDNEEPGAVPGEDTYLVMRRDFKATHLLVEKYRSPTVYRYARGDLRFILRYEDADCAIFELSGAADGN